jgi:hypothetical protein
MGNASAAFSGVEPCSITTLRKVRSAATRRADVKRDCRTRCNACTDLQFYSLKLRDTGLYLIRRSTRGACTRLGASNQTCRWATQDGARAVSFGSDRIKAADRRGGRRSKWCPGEDSNLHGFHHWYLKPARLPIPPPGHATWASGAHIGCCPSACQRWRMVRRTEARRSEHAQSQGATARPLYRPQRFLYSRAQLSGVIP